MTTIAPPSGSNAMTEDTREAKLKIARCGNLCSIFPNHITDPGTSCPWLGIGLSWVCVILVLAYISEAATRFEDVPELTSWHHIRTLTMRNPLEVSLSTSCSTADGCFRRSGGPTSAIDQYVHVQRIHDELKAEEIPYCSTWTSLVDQEVQTPYARHGVAAATLCASEVAGQGWHINVPAFTLLGGGACTNVEGCSYMTIDIIHPTDKTILHTVTLTAGQRKSVYVTGTASTENDLLSPSIAFETFDGVHSDGSATLRVVAAPFVSTALQRVVKSELDFLAMTGGAIAVVYTSLALVKAILGAIRARASDKQEYLVDRVKRLDNEISAIRMIIATNGTIGGGGGGGGASRGCRCTGGDTTITKPTAKTNDVDTDSADNANALIKAVIPLTGTQKEAAVDLHLAMTQPPAQHQQSGFDANLQHKDVIPPQPAPQLPRAMIEANARAVAASHEASKEASKGVLGGQYVPMQSTAKANLEFATEPNDNGVNGGVSHRFNNGYDAVGTERSSNAIGLVSFVNGDNNLYNGGGDVYNRYGDSLGVRSLQGASLGAASNALGGHTGMNVTSTPQSVPHGIVAEDSNAFTRQNALSSGYMGVGINADTDVTSYRHM